MKKKLSRWIKRFCLFLSVFLFSEIIFHLLIFPTFSKESIINILLYSLFSSSILSIITGIFKDKVNVILTSISLFMIAFLFCVQLVFYNTFKVFFSFETLGLSDQITSFMSEAIQSIIDNIFYILIFFIPFILYLVFHKKINLLRNNVSSYIAYFVILGLTVIIYGVHMSLTKDIENGTYILYSKTNSIALNMEKLGLSNAYLLDISRWLFGFQEELDLSNSDNSIIQEIKEEEKVYEPNTLDISFDKATSNNEIKTINNYMQNNTGTLKNEYTGIYQDYNLIYIVAESFSEIGVSEELTPTLYKLTHTGFIFDNYYTPNTLSTIGGEFQALTGVYPDSSILSKWRKGTNYFPYGLATIYQSLGYKTYAYHDNWYAFQDRHKYLKSQGFTNYIGCSNGMQKRMNCKAWPQSDLEMMKATINDYINDEKFMAYYMTVSGHFSYNFSDNSMANKNKKYVSDLNLSTAAKAYVATQIELDRALEYLINTLEEKGRLDDTVIVLLADHYPYKLSLKDVNSLSTFERDQVVGVNHNNLILWNSKQEDQHITKVCMSSDVLPTVYNLYGIEYDSRLLTGQDIFSTKEGLAIFNNRSWVSDKGTYYANNSKFVGDEELPEGYIDSINAIVKNRLNIGKLIIKNDYYKYLLK